MKCATLTFHRTTNFGAILQTYALQKALDSIGIENEVLDYRCPTIENRYKVSHIRYFLSVKNILKCLLKNAYIRDNRDNFAEFANRYIRISKTVYTPETIATSNSEYSRFIVGSDQVWNPECMGADVNYLLSFVKIGKKNSYAASFGWSQFSVSQLDWFKKYLINFSNISVRESSGVEIVRQSTGRLATVVIDPTLLLHQEWSRLVNDIPRIIDGRYVVIYLMKETDSIFKRAIHFAQSNNLKVVYINDRLFPKKRVINKFHTTPVEWLNLFYYSEGIFTNSFHGTAFATNFNKPLWVELLPEPSKSNSRLIDFLSLVHMEGCIVPSNDITTIPQIDYDRVNITLNRLRNDSIEYLKEIFYNE